MLEMIYDVMFFLFMKKIISKSNKNIRHLKNTIYKKKFYYVISPYNEVKKKSKTIEKKTKTIKKKTQQPPSRSKPENTQKPLVSQRRFVCVWVLCFVSWWFFMVGERRVECSECFGRLDRRLELLEGVYDELSGRVVGVEHDLKFACSDVSKHVVVLDARLSDLEADFGRLEGRLSDLGGRLLWLFLSSCIVGLLALFGLKI